MTIIKIRLKEKWFKLLFLQFYKYQYIELYFNFLENRIYYKDKNKDIPTGKDLSRSIKMIYEMVKRSLVFGNEFKLKEDNFSLFVFRIIRTSSDSKELSKIIFGTQPFNLKVLLDYCNALNINYVDSKENLSYAYNKNKSSTMFLESD